MVEYDELLEIGLERLRENEIIVNEKVYVGESGKIFFSLIVVY